MATSDRFAGEQVEGGTPGHYLYRRCIVCKGPVPLTRRKICSDTCATARETALQRAERNRRRAGGG